ncbi:MAG TPA: hypothetical protein VKU41_18600 [Polyangiaceae bacterium]|nr:hypothetical protein [Polyangiaceae bacterium]
MQPSPIPEARPLLSLDAKVIALALLSAAFTALGIFFQKVNGVRSGNVFLSGWLVLATVCFFPTFLITNKVFAMGGRMSLFAPVTAAQYVLSVLVGRFYFGEAMPWAKWVGCALIVSGVAAIAR